MQVPCHEITSFYTWDKLEGINTDLLWLFIDLIIFIGVLVIIEMGYVKIIIQVIILSKNIVEKSTQIKFKYLTIVFE